MLDVLIALVVAAIVLTLVVMIATRIAMGRRNRVVSGVPSPAPLSWLASSRREAVLHRKLRSAGRRLELVPHSDDVADVIERLQVELTDLDAHLVTVSRRPTKVRRADRRDIADQVAVAEDLVRRVEERSRDEAGSLGELADRLDLLEAADDELRGLGPG